MTDLLKRYDIFAAVALFALAGILEHLEAFSLIEDETLSYRQLLRSVYGDPELTMPSEDVFIVYTDEAFYAEYDKYPLTRTDLATIVAHLSEMGAKVIGVDMIFDFKSAYGEDATLAGALSDAGNVLLVSQAEFDGDDFVKINRAIDRFSALTSHGYSNISSTSAISESIVRLRVYPDIAEAGSWPFAVQAVGLYLDETPVLADGVLTYGDKLSIALDQFSDLYIDYPLLPGNADGGTHRLHEVNGMSASDLIFLEDEEELEELSFLVDGKIVLVGEVAEVAHDEFETPLGNVYGVEIIADTIATLLNDGPLRPASLGAELVASLAVLLALLVTTRFPDPAPRMVIATGLLVAYVVSVCWIYVAAGLIFSMSYVLIAGFLSFLVINARFYLSEMGQKALIRDAFGQYLSPKVVSDLVKDPEKLTLGGEEREMTAYFSDIAGFSSFSEKLSPTELVHLLNEYLTEMCNIIIGHDGTVDKFEGDAIIAFWGAPTLQADHARRACIASIDMKRALVPLREKLVREGKPEIHVRMGLNTGTMLVGNMGSAQRMNYTMMGDAVNLASRLEGANKAYASDLMISEYTYEQVAEDVDARELDVIRVVGKSEPVRVYQLLDRRGRVEGKTADLIDCYTRGLEAYRARDYQAAIVQFKAGLEFVPDDGPSVTYLGRCEQYLATPPNADWDGVFNLDEKG